MACTLFIFTFCVAEGDLPRSGAGLDFLQDRGTCTVMSTWQYLMLVRNFQYLDEFTVETLIGGRVYFVINWYFNGQIIFF